MLEKGVLHNRGYTRSVIIEEIANFRVKNIAKNTLRLTSTDYPHYWGALFSTSPGWPRQTIRSSPRQVEAELVPPNLEVGRMRDLLQLLIHIYAWILQN